MSYVAFFCGLAAFGLIAMASYSAILDNKIADKLTAECRFKGDVFVSRVSYTNDSGAHFARNMCVHAFQVK